MSAACVHDFVETARTTAGEVGILMGCRNCFATRVDWPGRKRQ